MRPSRAEDIGAGFRRPTGGVRCGSMEGLGGTTAGVEGVAGGLKTSGSVDVESVLSVRSSFVSLVSVGSTASVRFSVGGMSGVAVIGGLGLKLVGALSGTSWP